MLGKLNGMGRVAAVAAAIVLGGCASTTGPGPGGNAAPAPPVAQDPSLIAVSAHVMTSDLETLIIEEATRKPLAQGRTEKLNAKALVEEERVEKLVTKSLVRAAVPGHYVIKRIPRTVQRSVKVGVEYLKCQLRPWKWGKCAKDVFKTVTETVWDEARVWVEATVDEYKDVVTPVILVKEAVLPTDAWVNYRVDLKGISLDMQGDTVRVGGQFQVGVSVDLQQGILNEKVKIKGALACDALIDLDVKAKLMLAADGSLSAAIDGKPDLDLRKLCVPGAVQALNIHEVLNPHLLVLDRVLAGIVESKLRDKLQESLGDAAGKAGVPSLLAKAGSSLAQPIALGTRGDVWLSPRPEKILLGDLAGNGEGDANRIELKVAVVARPLVTLGARPAAAPGGAIAIEKGSPGGQTRLLVAGRVPLEAGAKLLEDELEGLFKDKLKLSPIKTGKVVVRGQGPQLVIEVDIVDRLVGRKHGTAVLEATPVYDAAKREFRVPTPRFTVETRNFLIKLAAWATEDSVEKFVADKGRWAAGETLDAGYAAIRRLAVVTPAGTLSGGFEPIATTHPTVVADALYVYAAAQGELVFQVKPGK